MRFRTPLIHAVRANSLAMVEKLLSFHDINPHIPDNTNQTPFDYAKELNYTE